jgi:hypothetical protein
MTEHWQASQEISASTRHLEDIGPVTAKLCNDTRPELVWGF